MSSIRLNAEQRAAVVHDGGPLLIIAGPGTGKTTVMVARAARLARRGARLLMVTFTRAARHQLEERLRARLGPESARIQVATFHSLAWQLVSRFRPELLVRLQKAGLPPGLEHEGRLQAVQARAAQSWGNHVMQAAVEFVGAGGPRKHLAGVWDELLIDEFQDTDPDQYALARRLTPAGSRIIVVGDDDQAIYGWRGAVTDLFFRFRDDHPGARRVTLVRNYRAHPGLVRLTNRIAATIPNRLAKRLSAVRRAGPRPRLVRPLSPHQEARLCLRWLQGDCTVGAVRSARTTDGDRTTGDRPPRAVIYRLRRAAVPLASLLDGQRIPYIRLDSGESLPMVHTAPTVCRDLLAYRRAALAARDPRAGRPAHAPPTPVSRRQLLPLAHLPPQRAVTYICRALDYDRQLYHRHGGGQALDAATAVLARVAAMQSWAEVAELAESQGTPPPLALSTAHGAKGLEFDRVWILGAVDGWFPLTQGPGGREARDEAWLAEEQRLFYVACTRAAEELVISASRWAPWGPARVTRFLPPDLKRAMAQGVPG